MCLGLHDGVMSTFIPTIRTVAQLDFVPIDVQLREGTRLIQIDAYLLNILCDIWYTMDVHLNAVEMNISKSTGAQIDLKIGSATSPRMIGVLSKVA